jgi:two-component system chemotaxis response regulator CheB
MPIASQANLPPIRVLVTAAGKAGAQQLVDDLSADPSLSVISATSSVALFERIPQFRPAVVLLDSQIAGEYTPLLVHGLTYQRQIPVVIYGDTHPQSELMQLKSLERGALAVAVKRSSAQHPAECIQTLVQTLKAASSASIANLLPMLPQNKVEPNDRRSRNTPNQNRGEGNHPRAQDPIVQPIYFPRLSFRAGHQSILTIHAGVGGFSTLMGMLSQLPANAPATVVTTPLPAHLTGIWASRMSHQCQAQLIPASDGATLEPGRVFVIPSGKQARVHRDAGGFKLSLAAGPSSLDQKPSLDALLSSLAASAGEGVIAGMLSGSGADGIAGLLRLREAGARSIVVVPQSSVNADLPDRVIQLGAAERTLTADKMAAQMLDWAGQAQPRLAA